MVSLLVANACVGSGARFDSSQRSEIKPLNLTKMSKYEKIEEIFSSETKNFDEKHINNLAPNKQIPEWVLDRLRGEGLTIEKVEQLQSEGFPICKYRTQITIHGICKELKSNRTAGGYVTLVVNGNKSLGVRWIAVDENKRQRIARLINPYKWTHQHNSSEDCFYLVEQYSEESVGRLREIEARIDKSLFFGNTSVYVASLYGTRYVVLEVFVNGIYEMNIDKFVESMTGETIEKVLAKRKELDDKIKAEREELDRKYAEINKRMEEEQAQWEAENPIPEGFSEVVGLQVGDIVCEIGRKRFNFYLVYKAGGYICRKPCTIDGSTEKYTSGHSLNRPERIKAFVKRLPKETKETPKPMQKTAETARKESSCVEIKDYKNAILVTGDTRPVKETLKSARGMWNKALQGWIFPKYKRAEVERLLS